MIVTIQRQTDMKYVSSQPDGRIEVDRDEAKAWERFTVLSWAGGVLVCTCDEHAHHRVYTHHLGTDMTVTPVYVPFIVVE